MKGLFKYFSNEYTKFKQPVVLAIMGLFIALGIVLTRVVKPIDLPYLRVSFGFIATAVCSMLLGPFLGGLNAALTDIAGFFLFPSAGGPFFPGLTLSALITGIIYGIFLHRKKFTLLNVVISVLLVTVFIEMLLNTYWLSILLDKGWLVLFPLRALKSAIFYPIQVFIIYYLGRLRRVMPSHLQADVAKNQE